MIAFPILPRPSITRRASVAPIVTVLHSLAHVPVDIVQPPSFAANDPTVAV